GGGRRGGVGDGTRQEAKAAWKRGGGGASPGDSAPPRERADFRKVCRSRSGIGRIRPPRGSTRGARRPNDPGALSVRSPSLRSVPAAEACAVPGVGGQKTVR